MITADAILEFWFGEIDDEGHVVQDRAGLWWKKHPETDALVKDRFEAHLIRAGRGEFDSWAMSAAGRLALIICFDQLPRNIHRDTPMAFAYDARARDLCLDGLATGVDRQLSRIQRVFFYLPLEHAEDRELQQRSVDLFTVLHHDAPERLRNTFAYYLEFAVRHKEIIDRFGRFPHRNAILGRDSTAEEREFLRQPGSGF